MAASLAPGGHRLDTLRQAVARGRLRAEKAGRDWLTTDAWLRAYLDSRRRGNFRAAGHKASAA